MSTHQHRLACVDLPAFALQLLGRRHPQWAGLPMAVVAEDRPMGVILAVDERARALRVLPGHRYAHALAQAAELRAGVVSPAEIAAGVDGLVERLRALSPEVEPCAEEPGVFWLDGAGLGRLYPSASRWARAVAAAVREAGFSAAVVAGFSRFGTYAVARAQRGAEVTVFRDADAERAASRRVPLDRLGLEPELRDALARLGVTTVGQLIRLPPGGLLERFGREALRLHQLAAGERWDPLLPRAPVEPLEERVLFDDPEEDIGRLMFAIKRALDPLLARLAARTCALAALHLELSLYRPGHLGTLPRVRGRAGWGEPARRRLDVIRPAEVTLDARALLRLVHLRLEAQPPAAGVVELSLAAEETPATREQLQLFAQRPRRDLRAADEALARLRAELGDDAVVRAILREGHLPEARYGWEPMAHAALPRPRPGERALVRRVLARPEMLPPQDRHARDDGWLLRGLEHGAVERIVGPYVVSGGWWRGEVHREYHFVTTRRGELLWVYYDRRRRRWYLHGTVE